MQLVLLIILIPICSISFFVYLNSLVNYAFNNTVNIPMFSLGIVLSLILSITSLHMFNNVRIFSAKKLNFENRIMSYFGYFSFIILSLFGISLLINGINYSNILLILIGALIIVLFIYITITYIFNYKKKVLILNSIEDAVDISNIKADENGEPIVDNKEKKDNEIEVKCLYFEIDNDDFIEYYTEKCPYEENHHYEVLYNPKLKVVKKIIKEINIIK